MRIHDDPIQFAEALPRQAHLLALDLGTKTIGLATTRLPIGIVHPAQTLIRLKFTQDAMKLVAFCREERIDALVLGLPLNMDGSQGQRVQSTKAFARNLLPLVARPILLFDERLSSHEAEDRMQSAGLTSRQRGERIDSYAAAIILEDALRALAPHLRDG
jgi:putative holliday junction resolvase